MTGRVIKRLFILLIVLAVVNGCRRHETSASQKGTPVTTHEIAPATARPSPTGTDAMTETVEVEDSRSEEDGGSTAAPSTSTVKPAPKSTPKPTAKTTKKH